MSVQRVKGQLHRGRVMWSVSTRTLARRRGMATELHTWSDVGWFSELLFRTHVSQSGASLQQHPHVQHCSSSANAGLHVVKSLVTQCSNNHSLHTVYYMSVDRHGCKLKLDWCAEAWNRKAVIPVQIGFTQNQQ